MEEALFQGDSVSSKRIIYTPSAFARSSLLHLQEVGELYAVKPHTSRREGLTSYLFFLVEKGGGRLDCGQQCYDLHAGDCVFLDCRSPYAHTSSEDHPWTLKWVHFWGPGMSSIYDKYTERGGRIVFSPENIDLYDGALSALFSLAGSQDHIRDMKINEKLAGLLTLIMAESWHPETSQRSGLKKQSLQNIRAYLEAHYREHISLDQLAEEFYINKYYLTRVFREQFGTTLLSYLDHIRITHAKQLLRFTDMTVEEIGQAVGIEEPSYFNRVFRKVEGITPGEYRKAW